MKLYLDNCCFNRPFDDQSRIRIMLETEAKLRIQEEVRLYKGGFIMITDTEIRIKGIKALTESLGDAEAERFISLI
jgi:hypothetical protein